MPADSRFTLPPEDFEELLPIKKDKKGKGKGKQNDGASAVNKKRKRLSVAGDSDGDEEILTGDEGEEKEELDLYDEVLNGPIPSTSKAAPLLDDDDDEGDDEEKENENVGDEEEEPLNTMPKPLQLDQLASYNSKVDKTGLIYLSRIPPGMGPSKVKHILSSYGDIGRIYLVAADSSSNNSRSRDNPSKHKHRPHRFTEGWIEFLDKRVARHTAELLNARSIGDVSISRGSKKNGGTKKWKDDVWTMKYLPRFKWNMLSEQVGEFPPTFIWQSCSPSTHAYVCLFVWVVY